MSVSGGTRRREDASPEGSTPRWHEIAATPEFLALETLRRRIVYGCLGVFAIGLGTFLVLCGYARPFMRRSVHGGLTVAYVWLLALTVLAWILVWVYLRLSERLLAPEAQRIAERYSAEPETKSVVR